MLRSVSLIGAGAAAIVALGCSSGGSGGAVSDSGADHDSSIPPCDQNPWSCGAGKTCWVTDQTGSYSCIAAGTKQTGETCTPLLGTTECGEGLLCLQTSTSIPGSCVSFCDSQHPCASGECMQARINNVGPIVHVCVQTGPSDAGSD
jgi:hypothetical protein